MFRKIISLIKIFTKDFYQNLNKKNIIYWIKFIIIMTITYISYKTIEELIRVSTPKIFINIYIPILTTIIIYRIILMSTNIFFFSKDLEILLSLPISSFELMISKFCTMLQIAYKTELIIGIIPLTIYGLMNYTSLMYFVWEVLFLVIFPIGICSIISMITILLMQIMKFIKDKNTLQRIINMILLILAIYVSNIMLMDIFGKQNFLLQIFIQLLENISFENGLKNFVIIFIFSILMVFVFIISCKKGYLDCVKNSLVNRVKKKNNKKVRFRKKNKFIGEAYILNDIKLLIRQPIFLKQTWQPICVGLLTFLMLSKILVPIMVEPMKDDNIYNLLFEPEVTVIILGILQCIFSLSKISLIAVSREGKNAIFMKYIPVSLYKQFLYKNCLQVIINIIVSVIILGIIYYYIPEITLINIALIFILSILINLINSYLMLIVDLRMPNLDWDSEYSILKKNDNKNFQYILTIFFILIYMYISSILRGMNFTQGILIEIVIFAIIFIIIDRVVKKNITKIFDKII